MFVVDPVTVLARELLREHLSELVAEACAWSVGLSDRPHHERRGGRVVPSGSTLGTRAAADRPLGDDQDGRLDLVDTRPGSFADALNALTPQGRLHAELFDEQVLTPYVLATCLRAIAQAQTDHVSAWDELLDELGEDGGDLLAVVHAAEWEAPLRIEAEQLVLAALGDAPLVQVEAEGLPLSLVKAAEALLAGTALAPVEPDPPPADEELAGVLFLAEAALAEADLTVPVPPEQAAALLEVLGAQGLEPEEVVAVLPLLPVRQETAERILGDLT